MFVLSVKQRSLLYVLLWLRLCYADNTTSNFECVICLQDFPREAAAPRTAFQCPCTQYYRNDICRVCITTIIQDGTSRSECPLCRTLLNEDGMFTQDTQWLHEQDLFFRSPEAEELSSQHEAPAALNHRIIAFDSANPSTTYELLLQHFQLFLQPQVMTMVLDYIFHLPLENYGSHSFAQVLESSPLRRRISSDLEQVLSTYFFVHWHHHRWGLRRWIECRVPTPPTLINRRLLRVIGISPSGHVYLYEDYSTRAVETTFEINKLAWPFHAEEQLDLLFNPIQEMELRFWTIAERFSVQPFLSRDTLSLVPLCTWMLTSLPFASNDPWSRERRQLKQCIDQKRMLRMDHSSTPATMYLVSFVAEFGFNWMQITQLDLQHRALREHQLYPLST